MSDEDANDYGRLKKAPLTRYNFTEDACRKRFRQVKPETEKITRTVGHLTKKLSSKVVRNFCKPFWRLHRSNGSDSEGIVCQRMF